MLIRPIAATGALADFGSPGSPNISVSNLFVSVDLHGRGIGAKLLAFLCDTARKDGVNILHVPSSQNAIGLYERMGFSKDADQPSIDDEITWMTKALG